MVLCRGDVNATAFVVFVVFRRYNGKSWTYKDGQVRVELPPYGAQEAA